MSTEVEHLLDVEAKPRSRRDVRRGALLLSFAAATAAGAWWTFTTPPDIAKKAAASGPVPVVLSTVRRENVRDYLTGIGSVQASASALLRTHVDGELQSISFVEGQDVKAGQPLAQIDPRTFQAQLAAAEAQRARDEAQLLNAQNDLKRYSTLVQQGSVSQQMLDTQQALVAQYRATVLADQAQVDLARVQLAYTTIRAPFDGRTGVRLIDVGNLLRASEATGIVTVNQIDPVALTFTLPEGAFSRINEAVRAHGLKALRVLAVGADNRELLAEGELLLVNNQIDTATGTIQLKAVFQNKQQKLWPGQFVNAHLVLGENHDALVAPASAVQRGPNGTFVYVVGADNSVTMRPVEILGVQDDKAIVAAGLQIDEVIVAEGQAKLRPGVTVADAGRTDSKAAPTAAHGEHP